MALSADTATVTVSAPGPVIDIAGHGVVRVCALPAAALTGLSSATLVGLVDELADLDALWRRVAPETAERLTDLVPTLADRGARAAVLRLRRRLHRADDVPAADIAALAGMPALADIAARRAELRQRLAAEYPAAWHAEQRALAELAGLRQIRSSAQLSSDGLLHNLDRYAAGVLAGHRTDKRSRSTETTLVHLVTRSVLKPSPFGQLVHTRPVRFGADGPAAADRPVSVCRLPRQLVNWLERTLAGLPALREHVLLRRAPAIAASPDGVSFLVRGRDGGDTPAAVERIVRVARDAVVDVLLGIAADEPVEPVELLGRCAAADPDGRPGHDDAVATLLAAGVLAADLGVGEQEPDPCGALVRLLPDDCPPAVRVHVTALRDIETAFGDATPEERTTLLAGLRAAIGRLAGECGVALPPLDAARTLVYEDVVIAKPLAQAAGWWAPHRAAMGVLHRILPVFDDDAHVRATVADVVTELFGPGPHRLLPLYAALSAAKAKSVLAARLVDITRPATTELRAAQDRILGVALGAAIGGADEISVAPDQLLAHADTAPGWASRWDRVSMHVQPYVDADGASRLMLNTSAIGYGRAMSRFHAGYSAAGSAGAADTERLRAELAAGDDPTDRLTDLSAVFGVNGNVHPALFGQYLCYPCGTPGGWPGRSIPVEDCWAVMAGGRPRILDGRSGPPLRLVPLNFLLNELAPQFYRFLNFFSSGGIANLALWDRVDQRGGGGGTVRAYPRVRLDGVVLARRTWKVPVAYLPSPDGPDGLAGFRETRAWQRDLGLPDLVFTRHYTLPDPLVAVDPVRREQRTRSLLHFPSSAARKPVLLDFTSVTSVLAWRRSLRRAEEDLTVQECLPLPGACQPGAPRGTHTREFVLETVAHHG